MRKFLVSASPALLAFTLLAAPLAHAQDGCKMQDGKMAKDKMSDGKMSDSKM